jgi:FKBP-type peptidyl-prolyl cis-trans isomerase FklB
MRCPWCTAEARDRAQCPECGRQLRIATAPARSRKGQHPFEGRLIDGTVFDSSYARGESISFLLAQVIAGWAEGVQLMPLGSKYELTIPHELGYGARGAPGVIPPYSTLIFDVELLKIY